VRLTAAPLPLARMPRRPRLTQLTTAQYDALERAIVDGRRLAVWRGGSEFVVIVDRFRTAGGREALEAHHPTTGDAMTLYIDELEGIEVVG
jgi:hypothetical protein